MWIIAAAYGLRPMVAHQWLKGQPGWAKGERYGIEAKAENDKASPDDLKMMLRNLLTDRFKLALHGRRKKCLDTHCQ